MIPAGLELQNPLWDYALKIYPPLSGPLLELQHEGARVNQVLAALWAASIQRAWPGAIPEAIEQWHAEQVLPMRQRRMAIKPELERHPELDKLYQAYKQVELNAERIELAMLHQWLQTQPIASAVDSLAMVDQVLALNGVRAASPAREGLYAALQHILS